MSKFKDLPLLTQDSPCLAFALQYLDVGWPVIPIGWDPVQLGWKMPLIEWKAYQSALPSEADIRRWFEGRPDARVGIVTGRLSGIVAVDIDPGKGGSPDGLDLPPTLISKTGGGGWHYLYAHPQKKPIKTVTNWPRQGIDIRGDGGLIVVPPSLHKSDREYEWAIGFDPSLIAPCPAWLAAQDPVRGKSSVLALSGGVSEGSRNDSATRVAGRILAQLYQKDWESFGWGELKAWNQKNSPPLDERELRTVFDSIASREAAKREAVHDGSADGPTDTIIKSKKSKIARDFIENSGIELFRDESGKTFVRIDCETHKELLPCSGTELHRRLDDFCYEKHGGEPASSDTITGILNILDAKARKEGETIEVNLRVAKTGSSGIDGIFYDLANREWSVVGVTRNGWSIVPGDAVHFRRYPHTGEQTVPARPGDIEAILPFVNINKPDEQLLLLCYLVSCFIPGIAHPILLLNGQKGSSKSTIMRMLKTLVDPSRLMGSSFPKDQAELAMVFSQNWVAAFDNVSDIPEPLSDMLCKVCTGDSFSKRKLWTDDDANIVSYQHCVMINGINNPAEKSDLLDRVILFVIDSIPKENRKPMEEIWTDFKAAVPKILGGVFDVLAKAMEIRPHVHRGNLSRLADFDLWGRAIAKALGQTEQDFVDAMEANIAKQSQEAIKHSPVALILLAWAERTDEAAVIEGTATELLAWFKTNSHLASVDTREREWPKSASALSRRLNEIAPDLLGHGVKIARTGDDRSILIRKIGKNVANAAIAQPKLNADSSASADQELSYPYSSTH